MKLSILITITFLCLGSFAGCSLPKLTRQSTPTTSSQINNNQNSRPPQTSAVQFDASSNETPKATSAAADELHTPAKGSDERQAIMDALRGNQQVVFQVNYLKVHNGWCWVDTTPLDKQGRATAEGGSNLLHLQDGKWKVMDLSKVPDDPNDPLGPEDASPTFIKNVMTTFPGMPRDIFPKPRK
jgi:hypothetical protein